MSDLIKHYFACGNTAKGFQNFFSSNLKNLDKIYILKGGPGTGKSSLMKKVGQFVTKKGIPVEYIHCSSDPSSLDGIVIRSIGTAIVDGTSPHVIEPTAPGAIEEYINLGTSWDVDALAQNKNKILFLRSEISACYPKAYDCFSKALKIHDEWEKIYINRMDFKKANQYTEEVISKLLGTHHFDKKSVIMHRFLGGSTPEGPKDFVKELTAPIKTRYFIKGRPGSGKSTMLKKILAAAQTRGIDAEVYHCGFDPDSLDMLLLPELDLCIFDSTAPHEYFPNRENDFVLDMYTELIAPHTDEEYTDVILDISKRYKACNAEGTSHLAYAKYLHDDLEKYYIKATNFDVINEITDTLLKKINNKLISL
ncbi:MAG: PRK06851 family protein [Candidatus Cellulosilyticum pullistercoris]|uniref:PRK06851 family protein n=1 Tax=Candidatus Cellulosilyticum pullistercoris TaxID=2838521 RepID=A0A9E2NKF9_9FIRM|nr:PRK06851 family protein [Candidatus Cellulosilyticum pullistercoris]